MADAASASAAAGLGHLLRDGVAPQPAGAEPRAPPHLRESVCLCRLSDPRREALSVEQHRLPVVQPGEVGRLSDAPGTCHGRVAAAARAARRGAASRVIIVNDSTALRARGAGRVGDGSPRGTRA